MSLIGITKVTRVTRAGSIWLSLSWVIPKPAFLRAGRGISRRVVSSRAITEPPSKTTARSAEDIGEQISRRNKGQSGFACKSRQSASGAYNGSVVKRLPNHCENEGPNSRNASRSDSESFPISSASHLRLPRSLRSCGDSHKLRTSTILCHQSLKSVFSSTCRVFVPSATALPVMLVSWWGLAVPLAIRLFVRKVLQTWFNFFDGLFHADKNFSRCYHCAQPAPHRLLKCQAPACRWKMPSLCWQHMCF